MRAIRLLAAGAALVACSSFDASPSAPAPTVDGGTDGGVDAAAPCARTCASGEVCTAGACVPGCADGIVYLAPDGDDGASGCDPAKPRKTIASAIDFARRAGAGVREIHACTGTYHEPRVTLDVPVSLLGGYGCTSQKRADDYGYPKFSPASATILESDDLETLVVSGAKVDRSVRIDGWTVRGSVKASAQTTALLVREGAAPMISNSAFLASALAGGPPSTGVRVASGARPDIGACSIDGGSGESASDDVAGSIGMIFSADAGPAHIHDNAIDGGRGKGSRSGSTGLIVSSAVSLTGPNAIERNIVTGGSGTSLGPKAVTDDVPVQGVVIGADAVDLYDNFIQAGRGTCAPTPNCSIYGLSVAVGGVGPIHVERNRIYGGDLVAAGTVATLYLPLVVSNGVGGTIVNNLLHLGNKDRATNPTSGLGIAVRGGKQRLIAHNTISGAPGPNKIYIDVRTKEIDARVTNNLLLATRGAGEQGVVVVTCDTSTMKELMGNTFVGFAAALLSDVTNCIGAPAEPFDTLTTAEARQNTYAAGSARSNFRFADGCEEDTSERCLPSSACITPYPGCIPNAVAFDGASAGYTNLFGDGWPPLGTGSLCSAKPPTIDLSTDVPLDVKRATRTAPVTVGAHELDGCP